MMDRIHDLETEQAVQAKSIKTLEDGSRDLWATVSKIRDDVSRVKVDVAKVVAVVGIIQIIATGVIVWALTKGKEEKHAARQVHQAEIRDVVGRLGPPYPWRPD